MQQTMHQEVLQKLSDVSQNDESGYVKTTREELININVHLQSKKLIKLINVVIFMIDSYSG